MNPLYNSNSIPGPANNPLSNMADTMQKFNEFQKNFKGDPKQAVMQLLQSGQMSNSQYNQFAAMAQQFMRMMPKK